MILFTGRFVERKGIRELLDAAALVLKERPAARFVLAGGHRHCDGVTMARYWMPEDLWVHRDRIHFTGWLSPEELADWYQRADILAVPSWYEPFGMVVLEGMLYGLPIVASNIGGPAEILEHDVPDCWCLPVIQSGLPLISSGSSMGPNWVGVWV